MNNEVIYSGGDLMKPMTWERSWILAVLSLAWFLAGCGGGSRTAAPTPAPVSVAVSVSPSSATLDQGATRQFTATVTGSANTAVTWSVQESGGGAITSAGLYTAPNTAGTFHVVATSQADPTKAAIAIATVVLTSAGQFAATGSLATSRVYHTATLLSDGRVLVTGGLNENRSNFTFFAISSAELFDPVTGTFSTTGAMNHPRSSHTATLLEDDTVLVAGGHDANGPVTTAEIYNPVTGAFSMAGDLSVARSTHTATRLANGTVLIAGGYSGDDFQPALGTAEIYDPATGAFASAGQLRVARVRHSASLLLNGQVLLAGGFTNTNNGQATFSAELYDPSIGMFFVTGNMTSARGRFVASVLPDGKVLVAGGEDDLKFLATAEVYDPDIGSFFAEGAMNQPRTEFAGVTLQDGTVLVCGGPVFAASSVSAELFRPGTGTFEATGSMASDRVAGHTATLLADGRVLVIGGWDNDSVILSTAELYTP